MSDVIYDSIVKQNKVAVLETRLNNVDMDIEVVRTRMEKLLVEQNKLKKQRAELLSELNLAKENV